MIHIFLLLHGQVNLVRSHHDLHDYLLKYVLQSKQDLLQRRNFYILLLKFQDSFFKNSDQMMHIVALLMTS